MVQLNPSMVTEPSLETRLVPEWEADIEEAVVKAMYPYVSSLYNGDNNQEKMATDITKQVCQVVVQWLSLRT